jgi:hypothetical protein
MNTKTPISFINTTAFLFLGIASMSPLAPRAAAQKTPPGPQDVRVVNTAAEPVPVKIDATTNTIKIDGTTNTVKAAQSGSWIVGITGTPSVTLSGSSTVQIGNSASSPALVRDVDHPHSQPFRTQVSSFFTSGSADTTVNNSATVPAGKRLIVEFVTVKITLPNGQAALFAKLDTSVFDQYITLTAAGNDSVGNTLVVATHKVFVIFDPGTIVQTSAFRNSLTGGGNILMTVSGYLEDI